MRRLLHEIETDGSTQRLAFARYERIGLLYKGKLSDAR